MPHLERKTKLIMTASVNKYINPKINTTTKKNKNNYKGNYIRVDTDFILKDNSRQLRRQLQTIQGYSFVFALMKCSYAAFGEQNKTDNDSKCQQVYKSQNKNDNKDNYTPDGEDNKDNFKIIDY